MRWWRLLFNRLRALRKVSERIPKKEGFDYFSAEPKASFSEAEALAQVPTLVKIHNLVANASNRFSFYVESLGERLSIQSYKFDYTASVAFADWFVVGFCVYDKDLNYLPVSGLQETSVDIDNLVVVRNVSLNFQAIQPILSAAFEFYRILNQVLRNAGSNIFASLDAGVVLTQTEAENIRKLFADKRRKSGVGGVEFVAAPLKIQAVSSDLQSLRLSDIATLLNREICDLYSIDSSLLNDPENKTYSNKSEALKALYTNTLIPAADRFCEAVTNAFALAGSIYRFDYDIASVENLLKERMQIWQVLKDAHQLGVVDKTKLTDFVEELTAEL